TQALGFLPKGKVNKGATWKQSAELGLGALGQLKVEHTYKYEGDSSDKDKDVAKISFTTDIKSFEPHKSASAPEGQPAKRTSTAYQVERGTLKATEGKGTLEFNTAAGRLVRATTSLQFTGELTI